MIIGALSACDNVEFEGTRLELVPPSGDSSETAEASDTLEARDSTVASPFPEGPLLYMGTRTGTQVSVHPVGEITATGLRPLDHTGTPGFLDALIERRLAPGTPLTLFAEGVRVGTLRVQETTIESGFCRPTPVASGVAEVVPGTEEAVRFLAVDEAAVADVPYGEYRPVEHTFDQRVAGLDFAAEALRRTGALWPPSVLESRADMQAVPLDGVPRGAIAATFVVGDRLAVGPPDSRRAHSIFILATGDVGDYTLDYIGYRPVADGGKGVARFFEQLDWDRDGQAEIVLEVFGERARWAAVLDRGPDGWTTTFESACS
ncbi:MAG: hypothetical protein RQ745_13570 [Longimicrobiales bacterium]|nr:hypothetical protein [Longimicrobiales bacterium]